MKRARRAPEGRVGPVSSLPETPAFPGETLPGVQGSYREGPCPDSPGAGVRPGAEGHGAREVRAIAVSGLASVPGPPDA